MRVGRAVAQDITLLELGQLRIIQVLRHWMGAEIWKLGRICLLHVTDNDAKALGLRRLEGNWNVQVVDDIETWPGLLANHGKIRQAYGM